MRRIAFLSLVLAVSAPAWADETGGWKGSVESSITFISSNKESESIFIFGKAQQRGENYRLGVDGLYNFARQTPNGGGSLQTSTDLWSLGGRFERDFGSKSFWYGSARFDRDGVNNLNFRQVYGAGLGYTIYENPVSSWRMSVGLSQVFEEYTTFKDDYLGMQAQSEYSRNLSDKLSLDHTFTYVPNTNKFSDYFFVSNLGLNYRVSEAMTAGFRWLVNFDSTPAAGSVKQSRTYALTLGYKF
jgi:putative salt-induced outer membrane protein YdiY